MSRRVPLDKEVESVATRAFRIPPCSVFRSTKPTGKNSPATDRPTDLEEDSEDGPSDLRSQPHTAAKAKREARKSNCAHPATPTLNRPPPAPATIGRPGHQSAL
ncbi:hypothetical protein SprV_0200741500 [Sparganum proliferum]